MFLPVALDRANSGWFRKGNDGTSVVCPAGLALRYKSFEYKDLQPAATNPPGQDSAIASDEPGQRLRLDRELRRATPEVRVGSYSTVIAMRNGAHRVMVETKSRPWASTSG